MANGEILGGIVATYLAGLWMFFIARRVQIKVWQVALNGIAYIGYIALMIKY